MGKKRIFRSVSASASFVLLLTLGIAPASAAVDCQGDFAKIMQNRQTLIAKINGFQKRRPTAQQACSTFTQLVASDGRALAWVKANQAWCQIPDDVPKNLTEASDQIVKVRGQACTAATTQARQIAQLKARAQAQQRAAGQQPAQAQPGSGVRLPQGAL